MLHTSTLSRRGSNWTNFYFRFSNPLKRASLWVAFPGSSLGKEATCNAGDPSLILGSGRSPGEGIGSPIQYSWASLVAQMVKNLPAMWETWVWSLGWEDPLEKGVATLSVILPGESPWTEEPGGLQSMDCKELDMTERVSTGKSGMLQFMGLQSQTGFSSWTATGVF